MKGKRILSMVIDVALIFLFEMFFYELIGEALFSSTYISVGLAYFIGLTLLAFLQAKWDGQTVGKRIVKLKVDADTKEQLSFLKYWVRFLIAYAFIILSAGLIVIVNIIMIIVRKDQKTIHDLIIHTHIERAG